MSYVFRQGDLPKLDLQVDRGTDFKAWQTQWDAYLSLSGLDKQSPAKQVQALTLCFSRETVTIVDNLGLTTEQQANAGEIIKAIKRYVEGQVNESVERRNFRKRIQQPGECFDDFLVSLRELAKTCNFCSDGCREKNIRDQIIEGLLEGDIVEELLKEKDLSLETTVSKCRAQEAARKQRVEISGSTSNVNFVRQQGDHFTTSRMQRSNTPQLPGKPPDRTPPTSSCPGCGCDLHPGGRQSCPAYRRVCHACKKMGHMARVCRSGRKGLSRGLTPPPPYTQPITRAVEAQPDDPLPQVNTSTVMICSTMFEPAPTVQIYVSSLNGTADMSVLPDSGADISVAGMTLLNSLSEHPDNLLPSSTIPRAVNGTTMNPIGKLPVTLGLGSKEYPDEFHIYPEVKGTLLSWRAAKGLGILPAYYPHQCVKVEKPAQVAVVVDNTASTVKCQFMNEFPSVFDGNINVMEGEKFHITLTEGAKPFCVRTPRSIPFAYRHKLKAELDLLLEQGIISPVTVPTEWCAPIVVAPKKNSDQIRMCVDLSHLNKFVKRERYQSDSPAQAVADIATDSAKIFTKLDALKGYHQCPLDEDSQLLTTFITPYGRFKYLRAPYGISSISEHYNRRMDEAFAGLLGYRRIVDDVVIYDSNEDEHADHVRQFLQRCTDKKIALNKEKCAFSQEEVTFAGFTLSANGYSVDKSIIAAISKFPTPANRTDLRSFFGLVNQLSASTPTIAGLLAPLRPLLSTKNEFMWSSELEAAFGSVKQSLTSAPILSYFDPVRPTRLCTDASRQGLGFILQQKSGDSWTLIQAHSRFLSDTESRYAVIELELLAVVWAITN